jgi:hypothetical protein
MSTESIAGKVNLWYICIVYTWIQDCLTFTRRQNYQQKWLRTNKFECEEMNILNHTTRRFPFNVRFYIGVCSYTCSSWRWACVTEHSSFEMARVVNSIKCIFPRIQHTPTTGIRKSKLLATNLYSRLHAT